MRCTPNAITQKVFNLNENYLIAELSNDQAHVLLTNLNKALDVVDLEDGGVRILLSESGEHQVSGHFNYDGGYE